MTFLLRLAFGLVLVVVVVTYADVGGLVRAIKGVRPGWVCAAFVASLIGSILVPAVITWSNMRVAGISIPLPVLIRINLSMRFYVLTLPHAITVGMRWLRYRSVGGGDHGPQLAALMAFERIVVLFVVVSSSGVFLWIRADTLPQALQILLPAALALTLLLFMLVLSFVSSRAFDLLNPLIEGAKRLMPARLARGIDQIVQSVKSYQKLGREGTLKIIVWGYFGHALSITSGCLVSIGLGLPFGFADIGWMRSVIYILTLLPVTVGGLGVREAGFAGLLTMYGIDPSVSAAFPLILLGIQLMIGGMGASVELCRVIGARRRTDAATVET